MLKKVLLGIGTIILLPFIIAIFLKKDYGVQRSIQISKPKAEVFEFLKYLKNQDEYTVWSKIDPKMEKKFTGTDGTVGAISYWKSSNPEVGEGEQEIKSIQDGYRVDVELRFIEPFQSKDKAYYFVEAASDKETKVVWGFEGKMDYPMNLMIPLMGIEKEMVKAFDTNLSNLKKVLEK